MSPSRGKLWEGYFKGARCVRVWAGIINYLLGKFRKYRILQGKLQRQTSVPKNSSRLPPLTFSPNHNIVCPYSITSAIFVGKSMYSTSKRFFSRHRSHTIGASIFVLTTFLMMAFFYSTPASKPVTSMPVTSVPISVCEAYSPLYVDAIMTHDYFVQRGGINKTDYEVAAERSESAENSVQIKLYGGNLFIGNVTKKHCPETRANAVILNLYRAVEQARMENELLPDIDVFFHCNDYPLVDHAIWNLMKTRDHAAADPIYPNGKEGNFFLIPDHGFYSWPDSLGEPWTYASANFYG